MIRLNRTDLSNSGWLVDFTVGFPVKGCILSFYVLFGVFFSPQYVLTALNVSIVDQK